MPITSRESRITHKEIVAHTRGDRRNTRMEISELKAELEKLHTASFGWALNCCQRNRADAEEVLQTVYLKILQGKAIYRGDSRLQTWLFAVIRNTALAERRKNLLRTLKTAIAGTLSETGTFNETGVLSETSRHGTLSETGMVSDTGHYGTRETAQHNTQLELAVERSEMQRRFQQALSRLPARQRETLHLVFYQDLSLSEAAEVMNISIGSARRHYERGKKRLREALEREGVDYGIGWRRNENSGAVL